MLRDYAAEENSPAEENSLCVFAQTSTTNCYVVCIHATAGHTEASEYTMPLPQEKMCFRLVLNQTYVHVHCIMGDELPNIPTAVVV